MDKSNPLDILGRRALHAMRRTEAALSPWVRRALRRQHQTIEHAHLAMSLNELPLRRLRRRVARQLNEDGSLAGDMGSLSPELVQRFTDRVVNRLPMRKIAAKYEAATAEKGDQTSDELPSTAMPLVNSYGNEAATHSSPKNQDADSAPMLTAADVIARLQTQMPNAGTQGNTPTQPSSTQTSAATPSRLQRIQAARETTERASISNSANTEKSPLASNPVARPNTGAIRRFSRVEEVSPAAKNSTPVSTTAQPRNRAARSTSLPAAAPTDNDASKDDDSRTGSAQDPLASIPTKQPQAAAPKTKEIAASTPAVLPAVTRSFAPTLTTAPTITSGSVPIQRSEMPETDFAIHQQAEQQMASAATSRATPVQRLAHTPRLLQAKRKSAQLRKDIADALGSATTESGSTSEPQVAKSNTKPPITRSPAQASNPVGNLQASEMQGIQSLNPTTTQIRKLPSDREGTTQTNQEISSQPELSSPSMQRSSLHERVSDTPHSIDSTFATPIAFEEPAAKSPQMMRHESKFEQAQRSADPQTRPVANIDATQDLVDGGVTGAQPRINISEVDMPLARQSHLQRGGRHGNEVDTDTHVSDETSQQNAFDTSAISKLAETEAKASQPTLNRSIDNAPLTSTATAVNTPTIAANTLQPTIERHIDDPLEPNIASRSEKPSVVSHTADEIESAKLQRAGIARPSNENRNTTSESTTPATRQIVRLPTEIQFDSQQFEATPGLSGAAQPDAHLGTSPLTEALDMPLVQRSKQAVTDEGASDSTVEVNAPIMHVGASKVATRKSEATRQGTEPSVALSQQNRLHH